MLEGNTLSERDTTVESAPQELGEVIAERTMQFVATAGWKGLVTVRVGRPVHDDQLPPAWFCPYQIEGVGAGKVQSSLGADAIQALQASLHLIPIELAGYLRKPGGHLRFLDQTGGSWPNSDSVVALLFDPCRSSLTNLDTIFPRRQSWIAKAKAIWGKGRRRRTRG